MSTTIDVKKLKQMFINGAKFVSNEFEYINELNVFPVPDGDTGTNLKITIDGACDSIRVVEHADLLTLGKQFSRGLLMNARGNSGVIFSQIMKGFTINFKQGQSEIDIPQLIDSFAQATKVSYEAISTPVEGTILTVIRETSEALKKNVAEEHKSMEMIFELICKTAKESLLNTPNILPELKESGVVDSGGYGLCCFLNGMNDCLNKKDTNKISKTQIDEHQHQEHLVPKKSFIENLKDKNEGFGYCTEFIMILKSKISLEQKEKSDFEIKYFKKTMNKIGNSLAVVVDDDMVKVHIHTKRPYDVLREASYYGEFSKVKIENMTFQFLENNPGTILDTTTTTTTTKQKLSSTTKIIATIPSNEIAQIFKNDLRIEDIIITDIFGNPSISSFFKLIKNAKSSNIILVVNDSNIMLAAREAIKLTPKSIKIELLKADDIGSSYIACSEYDAGLNFKANLENIRNSLEYCSSAKISYSIKNTESNKIKIQKNEFIGIFKGKIIISNKKIQNVCKKMIDLVVGDVKRPKSAFVFYNKNAKQEDINFIRKYLNERHLLQVKTIFGGQKTYPFIVAVK